MQSRENGAGRAVHHGAPDDAPDGVQVELEKSSGEEILYGEMTAACDFSQGFSISGLEQGGAPLARAGIPPWQFLPIRTGVGFGARTFQFRPRFGLKIWAVQLDIASDNIGWLLSHDSFSRGSAGCGAHAEAVDPVSHTGRIQCRSAFDFGRRAHLS